jgi:hypothetical protein
MVTRTAATARRDICGYRDLPTSLPGTWLRCPNAAVSEQRDSRQCEALPEGVPISSATPEGVRSRAG